MRNSKVSITIITWSWSYDNMLHLRAGAMRRLLSRSILPSSATSPKAEHCTCMAGSWWVSAPMQSFSRARLPCMISGQWPEYLFFLLSSPWALVVLFGQRFILGLALQEANFLQAFPTAVNLCGH